MKIEVTLNDEVIYNVVAVHSKYGIVTRANPDGTVETLRGRVTVFIETRTDPIIIDGVEVSVVEEPNKESHEQTPGGSAVLSATQPPN